MSQEQAFTTRPELAGTFGMVASTHWLASSAGMAALEAGGNAFDAAVAAGLVLEVVEPHQNGLGGEVPIIGYDAEAGEVFVLDGQGPAPAAATLAAFADLGLDLVPGTGLLAPCVPAAFGTWMLLLERYGRLPLREVMQYAIGYAGDGFPLADETSAVIGAMAGYFAEHWPSSAELWLASGVPAGGARFQNDLLANTYRRLLAEGEAAGPGRADQIEAARRAFYSGFVAEAITAYLEHAEVMDTSGRRHRGLLSGDDLAGWRASAEQPVTLDFRGLTVCKTGPWGQGPVMLQQLALLDGLLGDGAAGPGSAEYIHTVIESAKLAFADREAWYGDPRQVQVPMAELLSAGYAAERRGLLTDQAAAELRPGSPGGLAPQLPPFAIAGFAGPIAGGLAAGAGEPTAAATALGPGDTVHLDAADSFGNMVSCTPSGGWLHSSPAIPGLGFCLGTRAQMFALVPGLPGSLAPGKRPRTTLSPGLALRDGEPYLAFGTPGGDQQDQWPLWVFLNHVVYGMNLQEAIDAPAFHTDHFPSSFWPRESEPRSLTIEDRVGEPVIAELRRRGHEVTVTPSWSLGKVTAVSRSGGLLHAAANPRFMQGYAVGR